MIIALIIMPWYYYPTAFSKGNQMTITIRDLKNTTELSRLCHESTEPIVVTKNGYDDMVIMSSECFERHKVGFYRSLYSIDGKKTIYTIPQIKQILDPILEKHEVKTCTLFGSYAKGEACSISDIDLMIDCKERGLKFFGILEEMSSSFDVPIDLIAKYQVKGGSDTEAEIKRTGIIIFTK